MNSLDDKILSINLLERIINWISNGREIFKQYFTFHKLYFYESKQALRRVRNEFYIYKDKIQETIDTYPLNKNVVEEIENLISEAEKVRAPSKLWPIIYLIELDIIKLYNLKKLLVYSHSVDGNLNILNENRQNKWREKLTEFNGLELEQIDVESFREVLSTVTFEINEAHRINNMTNELKQNLLKRFILMTVIIGALSWIFLYSIVKDPLIGYGIFIGMLGGFFSRVLSVQSLEFKPPAFSLISLYTYTQPFLGGIGALVLYLVLISPLGPQIISGDTFYLSPEQTKIYFGATIQSNSNVLGMFWPSLANSTSAAEIIINRYPKPGLFLLLSFFAGFSERWLLGTLETIVGKKLQKESNNQECLPKAKEKL